MSSVEIKDASIVNDDVADGAGIDFDKLNITKQDIIDLRPFFSDEASGVDTIYLDEDGRIRLANLSVRMHL